MLLERALALSAAGIAGGILTSLYLTRFLQTMLYNVNATHTPTLVAAVVLLLGVTVIAISIPVRRATSLNPITVLTEE
jgi:ABC-type antimicrobial peptide transport system permease subunit